MKIELDVNHILRSLAIAAVGIPLAISTSGLINTTSHAAARASRETGKDKVYATYTDELAKACIGWATSKVDSKLERESKNTIDEVMGGEVDYSKVCNAFVF